MKITYVMCSECGKQVSNAIVGHDIVVRAWIECPECLEKNSRTPTPLQSVITWIPVSERLPEAYKVVLATSPSQGLFMGWHRCSVTDWIIHLAPLAMRPIEDVTHWAELPATPAGEEGER